MDPLELLTLSTLVLCDEEADPVNVRYLFAQTADNESSVLQKGVELNLKQNIPLAICGGTGNGYPGFSRWNDTLIRAGVVPSAIISVPPLEPLNTFTEATGLVLEAKRRGWKRIEVVSSPFHQLRAFMSVVQALIHNYPTLQVYNRVGRTLDWNEYVAHNQGIHTDYRKNLIASELERIEKYHLQGNLPSLQEALLYLQKRPSLK